LHLENNSLNNHAWPLVASPEAESEEAANMLAIRKEDR
jgi:hypothetical protein